MISDNQMISRRQASWIFFMDMLAAGLFSLSAVGKKMTPLTMILGCLLALVLVMVYYSGFFRLFGYYEKKTGKKLSMEKIPAVLSVLWLIFYFLGLIWAMQFFYHVIDDRIPVNYGWPVPILFLLAALIYGAGKGVEVRGRMAELMGWMIGIPFILLFIFGLWQVTKNGGWQYLFHANNWLETTIAEDIISSGNIGKIVEEKISENTLDFMSVLKIGFEKSAFLMLADSPLFLWRCVHGKDGKSGIYSGTFWGAGLMLMVSVLLTVLTLNLEGIARENYPFGVVLQLIRLPGNFISRYDIFFVMLWMMSYFIFAGGMLVQMIEAVKNFINSAGGNHVKNSEKNIGKSIEKKLSILFGTLVLAVLLCGCYAEREPQNRNYIMCMGIDVSENGEGWTVSYGFPDLGALTGTDTGEPEPVRIIEAATITDAARRLEASSDKTTDYSQMPVIIIGKDLLENEVKRTALMNQLAAEKAIRRTALVACAENRAEDILALDDDVQGSVGVFIYELCQNNSENKGYTMSILQDYIGGLPGQKNVIPLLDTKENKPEIIELISYKFIQK